MRPFLEKLPYVPDASWSMLDRRLDDAIPFQWHHHPEFELTLTLNSRGQRFIGDHVGEYGDGDLVLVGPNLPHTWASRDKINADRPHVALVFWFHPDWALRASDGFVELRAVRDLLARAGRGLSFAPDAASAVRGDCETVFGLPPFERLIKLLGILDRLARGMAGVPLASEEVRREGDPVIRERIDRVLLHIHTHYARTVTLEELADIAALSVSGLHRLFRRHTGTMVSDYLTRMRIGDACARLSGTRQPIAHIAEAVGYGTAANFNRQFKAHRAMTPRQYRAHFRRAAP